MITEAFDNQSNAIIQPQHKPNAIPVDACILTFSYAIEAFVKEQFPCEKIASL